MMDLTALARESLPLLSNDTKATFNHLLKVYIDDFIGLIQATNEAELRRFSRCILHAIYNAFPPPQITKSDMGPAVSEKKLIKEGTWETRKEILGWLIDGINCTIKLPMGKCKLLIKALNEATNFSRKHRKHYIPLKQFQKIHKRLQFARMAMAIGIPLLGPLDKGLAVAAKSNADQVVLTKSIYHCLKEW